MAEGMVEGTLTSLLGKRDLLTCQKKPTYMPKETYVHAKRDLLYYCRRKSNPEERTRVCVCVCVCVWVCVCVLEKDNASD